MDETNHPPPATIHKKVLWFLTFVLLALELHQFRKGSFFATAAVLNLCSIVYYHWRPRNIEYYTAMEHKVTLRILTLILCITVFFQLLSYSPLLIILIVILLLVVLYLHPKRTFSDKPSDTEGDSVAVDEFSG